MGPVGSNFDETSIALRVFDRGNRTGWNPDYEWAVHVDEGDDGLVARVYLTGSPSGGPEL
jgi:hypothetical protein